MRVKICSMARWVFFCYFSWWFTYILCYASRWLFIVRQYITQKSVLKSIACHLEPNKKRIKAILGSLFSHIRVQFIFKYQAHTFEHAHAHTYNSYTICRRFYSWNVRNVDADGKNQRKWKRSECEKNKCARSTYTDWIGAHFQNVWSDGVFLFSIHLMSVCAANDDIIYWYTLPCRVDRLNIKFSKQSMSHWISHQSDIRAQTAFTDQFCWFFTCEVGERASEWIWMVEI